MLRGNHKLDAMGITTRRMRRITTAVAALILGVSLGAGVPFAAAHTDAHPVEQSGAVCSPVVVIAARGSGEQRVVLGADYPSTWKFAVPDRQGWEGKTLYAMYRHIDAYARATENADLFEQVSLLPLDQEYPAVAVNGSDDGYGSIPFGRVYTSSRQGTESALRTIADYEATTGCHPKYLLNGYSQGALALQGIEVELERREQLAGVVYLGTPIKLHNDPRNHIIGKDLHGGLLVADPNPPYPPDLIASGNRTEYCIATDLICNFVEQNGENFVVAYGGDHKHYFRGPASEPADRDQVAEDFLRYVRAAVAR